LSHVYAPEAKNNFIT